MISSLLLTGVSFSIAWLHYPFVKFYFLVLCNVQKTLFSYQLIFWDNLLIKIRKNLFLLGFLFGEESSCARSLKGKNL
jgi:hypothetical protein